MRTVWTGVKASIPLVIGMSIAGAQWQHIALAALIGFILTETFLKKTH